MKNLNINGKNIGPGQPVYVIAEMSANHGQDKQKAIEIIHAMKESGANAVKLQTYTPETLTLDCHNRWFVECLRGTLWQGQSLFELYKKTYTPWMWQLTLKNEAERLGMDCFSTPFDETAVDFLETIGVPAYKVASFEIVHLPLIRRIAATGKPMILSTGMATKEEIQSAITAAREAGAVHIALLKCTSAYPAKMEDANLRTLPHMVKTFDVPLGLSDHTLGSAVPVMAVTQGACIIEKHFVLDRQRDKGPDSAFSMEPDEFREMVNAVRAAERDLASVSIDEACLGQVTYGPTDADKKNLDLRPSVFVVKDIAASERVTEDNIRIIRPGYGLPPKEWKNIIGRRAAVPIKRGTPLLWELLDV